MVHSSGDNGAFVDANIAIFHRRFQPMMKPPLHCHLDRDPKGPNRNGGVGRENIDDLFVVNNRKR